MIVKNKGILKTNINSLINKKNKTLKRNNIPMNKISFYKSFNKRINELIKYRYFFKDLINYGHNKNEIRHNKSKSNSIELKYSLNQKNDEINKNYKKPFYRKIYSNEYLIFENEITKYPHYIKKYKEDEITFTKNNILPEIKWQNYDNDNLTSEDQKKGAIKKEIKNLGETIKRIENNDNYFKYNVLMFKLSQKYPKLKN